MEKTPILVNNVSQISRIGKNQIAIIGNVGKKKKIEMAKKAKEMKIEVYNLNPEKFLKLNEKKTEVKNSEVKKWI